MKIQNFKGIAVLAPMMKGGNPYFRQIARRFGADIQAGSMAFAARVRRRIPEELVFVTRFKGNETFCAQITGCELADMLEAGQIIEDRGASVLDINACCPRPAVVNRNMGAGLLRRKSIGLLASMVESLKSVLSIPVTVKVRAAYSTDRQMPQIEEIVSTLEKSGADAITVHARYRSQFYGSAAKWPIIGRAVAAANHIAIIGNGDIRRRGDVKWLKKETGCHSVSIARAALQRPWIFREIKEDKRLDLDPVQRWEVFLDLYQMAKENVRANPQLLGELVRFHAGWFAGWSDMERQFRHQWAALDILDSKTERTILNQLQTITLRGPQVLPPLEFKHFHQRDNQATHG